MFSPYVCVSFSQVSYKKFSGGHLHDENKSNV